MCEGYENYTYDQLDYANSVISTSSRTESFDDFRINDIKKELTVSTSTQLVYVLEKGLKPNCVPGSNAERVYNRAKQILRTIVDDDMNDVEKLKAIYDWLIVNVEYDNLALNKSNSINEFEYKAWYAEGVFDHGVAVCAGIAEYFGIDPSLLFVTVYTDDEQAKKRWIEVGLDPSHIIPLEGNYWEIGEGPCGPDSEIFYDRGEKYDPNHVGIKLLQEDIENDRYIEIWNIVFSQYNAKEGLKRSEYPELISILKEDEYKC